MPLLMFWLAGACASRSPFQQPRGGHDGKTRSEAGWGPCVQVPARSLPLSVAGTGLQALENFPCLDLKIKPQDFCFILFSINTIKVPGDRSGSFGPYTPFKSNTHLSRRNKTEFRDQMLLVPQQFIKALLIN